MQMSKSVEGGGARKPLMSSTEITSLPKHNDSPFREHRDWSKQHSKRDLSLERSIFMEITSPHQPRRKVVHNEGPDTRNLF